MNILRIVLLTFLLGALGACSSLAPQPVAGAEVPWYAGTQRMAD